jgi:hypothetical protein
MTVLDYSVERDRGTPPLWLTRTAARALILLAHATHVEQPFDVLAASRRAQAALAHGFADVPLLHADCLALFTAYAELPLPDQDDAAERAALLMGDNGTRADISTGIADLNAALDAWATQHMGLTQSMRAA